MKPDPIVAEVRAVRERLAARFDYDIDAIVRHVQKLEAEAVGACSPSPEREALAEAAKARAVSEETQPMGRPRRTELGRRRMTIGGDDHGA